MNESLWNTNLWSQLDQRWQLVPLRQTLVVLPLWLLYILLCAMMTSFDSVLVYFSPKWSRMACCNFKNEERLGEFLSVRCSRSIYLSDSPFQDVILWCIIFCDFSQIPCSVLPATHKALLGKKSPPYYIIRGKTTIRKNGKLFLVEKM